MNCRTCQHELSQCLDGRLPSGRRTAVMQHADDCPQCAAFWAELQQAQEMVLRLPRQHVGPEFREGLWERIQSGEGTPPAVFQEPVPLQTKVRYLLTGAAAAALLLVAFQLGTSRNSATPENITSARHSESVATPSTPAPQAPVTGLVPRMPGFEPLTPTLMATEAARQFHRNLTTAGDYAKSLRSQDDGVASRLCESAGEMTRLGRVLLDLHAHEQVWFSEPVSRELQLVVDQFDNLPRRDEAAASTIAMVLRRVPSLDRLPMEIRGGRLIYSCDELDGFQMRWARRPEVFELLFFSLPQASGSCPDPLRPNLLPQGDCETRAVLVAPRSRMMQIGGISISILRKDH